MWLSNIRHTNMHCCEMREKILTELERGHGVPLNIESYIIDPPGNIYAHSTISRNCVMGQETSYDHHPDHQQIALREGREHTHFSTVLVSRFSCPVVCTYVCMWYTTIAQTEKK